MLHAPRSRASAAVPLLLLLGSHARATWSIVVANTATGEVGVASATCLSINLQSAAGVIVVGRGAGQSQAMVDSTGSLRLAMFNAIQIGLPAPLAFEAMAATQGADLPDRQIGIVTLGSPAFSFTGGGAFRWAGGVTGQAGPIAYAIQGNILTCEQVVLAAEAALVATPGDLGQKVMAAMQAAKLAGGDGRCSCSPSDPTSCGCPPPGVWKSAHVAYMTIARIGDTNGVCNPGIGCANGDYYLDLNVIAPASAPDPVNTLQTLYDNFRASRAGHADALLSERTLASPALPADGTSATTLTFALRDLEGAPLTTGGASVSIVHDAGSTALASIGPVVDHGDGTYSASVVAGTAAGADLLRIVVDDGLGPVTLYPFLALELATPGPVLLEIPGEATGHRLGSSVAPAGDLDGDGVADLLVGAPESSPGGFAFSGSAKVHSGATGVALLAFEGTFEEGRLGTSVARIGDVDGDGVADFAAGAPSCHASGCPPGAVLLFSGASGAAFQEIRGTDPMERFGLSIGAAGDLDEDGTPDLLVGAPGLGAGAARAYSGGDGAPIREWFGDAPGDGFGFAVASVGDRNGDGVPEVLVGAPAADPGGIVDAGSARCFSGKTGALLRALEGVEVGEQLGFAVASAGRVDADAVEDWVVGAPGADVGPLLDAGRATIYSGASGLPIQVLAGSASSAHFGSGVTGLPDANGDLRAEVAVGADGAGPGGEVTVFSAANGLPLFTHAGLAGDLVGTALATAGDLNGDGVADLLVGASGADPSGIPDAGKARVLSLAGLGGAIPVHLRARVALQRVEGGTDLDALGSVEVRVAEEDQSLALQAKKLDLPAGARFGAFLEDGAGSGDFLALGELEALQPGRFALSLSAKGAPPAQLGVGQLAALEGRRLEVRDEAGEAVLRALLPPLAGAGDLKRSASLFPPGAYGAPGAVATLSVSRKGSKGTERFDLRAKGLPAGPRHSVWVADAPGGSTFALVGTLAKGKLRRDTGRGDPLPLGAGRLEQLGGRAIEVRDGATALLAGTIP